MKKIRMTFSVALAILVLFSSCKDRKRIIPIASIPVDAYCVHCENLNSGFITVSESTLDQTSFLQLQEIIPFQETVFEFKTHESEITTSPTILPDSSPYTRTETPHEDRRQVGVIVPPSATAVTFPQPVPKTQILYKVQVGAFTNTANAQRYFDQLKSAGFNPIMEQSGSYTRLVIPSIESQNLAATINRLNNAGFMDTWVRKEL